MSAIDDTCLRQYAVMSTPRCSLTLAPPFTIVSRLPALAVALLDAFENSLAVAAVFADVGARVVLAVLVFVGFRGGEGGHGG